MSDTQKWARVAQILSIVTFVTTCWVVHRSLQVRTDCVNSSYIGAVFINNQRILNCNYESRLNLSSLFKPLKYQTANILRGLEILEPLTALRPGRQVPLTVEIVNTNPRDFELNRQHLRLGRAWLEEPMQVQHALTMAWLNAEHPDLYANPFNLEMMADLLSMMVFREDRWLANGQTYHMRSQAKFPTVSPSLESYCRSPFRSIAHQKDCNGDKPKKFDAIWGFRPLFAVTLAGVLEKISLEEQMKAFETIRHGVVLPELPSIMDKKGQVVHVDLLVAWFQKAVPQYLTALGLDPKSKSVDQALQTTYKQLDLDAPVKWELTVDVTSTPVWQEIVKQLKERSVFRPNERVLIFTPEGPLALPGAFPVAWAAADVRSQKHVMIACEWPPADAAITVRARHMYAQQSCARLANAFWD